MSTAADSMLRDMLAMVGYLRITTGADRDAEREWFRCGDLLERPDELLALVRSTSAGRGTDDDAVAMSLFVQGYVYRIASTAIGAFVVSGDVLAVDPAITSFAIGRDRPNAVHLDEGRVVEANGDLAVLHRELIDRHLATLVDVAHDTVRIGRPLLWSNVASSCAASFGAFVEPLGGDAGRVTDLVASFFSSGSDDLARAGRVVRIGRGSQWAWERSACCLWYQTTAANGSKCGDCSLWSDAERSARYAEQSQES